MSRSLASRIEAANVALIVDRNFDWVSEFFAPSYVGHGTGRDLAGRSAIRRFLGTLLRAFPDLEIEVEILVSSRDRVAWQRKLRATHTRNYKGFAATGRSIVWRDMVTSRFRNGLIAEDWVMTDLAERLLLAGKR